MRGRWARYGCCSRPAHTARTPSRTSVQYGFKCGQCHVNPTGGGLRTAFGDIFAQTVLPAQHIDTALDNWAGQAGPYVRVGGDLRFDASVTKIPAAPAVQEFSLEQTRVYLQAEVRATNSPPCSREVPVARPAPINSAH